MSSPETYNLENSMAISKVVLAKTVIKQVREIGCACMSADIFDDMTKVMYFSFVLLRKGNYGCL